MLQRATWRSTKFCQEAEAGVSRRAWLRAFIMFSVGKARQGKGNSLGLASLNNVSRLWAIGVVSSCLVPGSG